MQYPLLEKIPLGWLAFVGFCALWGSLTWLAYELHKPLPPEAHEWSEPEVTKLLLDQAVADSHTGDLESLVLTGKLRILTQHIDHIYLPRHGYPPNLERRLTIDFAEQLGIQPVFLHVERFSDLLSYLEQGYGDVAVANLTITDSRKAQVAFTVPVSSSHESIVTRATDKPLNQLEDLSKRTLSVPAGTAFWDTAQQLQGRFPDLKLKLLPGNATVDQNLDRLERGEIDLLIGDSNVLDAIRAYRNDFRVPLVVSQEKYQAWAVRKNNPQLLERLNRFLTAQALLKPQETLYFDDLPSLKERKTLRLLTRNNAACYFLLRGELMGFEYEIINQFAKQQDLHLEIIVAPTHEELVKRLLEGKGDLIAAFMAPSEDRLKQGVAFSRPYHFAEERLVMRTNDTVESRADLHQRILVARPASEQWHILERLQAELQQEGVQIQLQAAPEDLETEEIINRVATGEYDLTLADSPILDIELAWRDDIKAGFALKKSQPQAWAVRQNNPELLRALNDFHKKQYRSLTYNVIYQRYFHNSRKIRSYQAARINSENGHFSPYDDLVQRYAKNYLFDWRLIVAQMYQESQFDPKATAWTGASGLMQLVPRTAKQFGVNDLTAPEQNIRAGIEYLDWVRERFEDSIPVKDRLWFALAGYNAGWGHVQDARRLAEQQGLNPNRWFNQVEKAMLLLSKEKYAEQSRYGYVRGSEPVRYVHEIRERYRAYLQADQSPSDLDIDEPMQTAQEQGK